MGGIKLKDNIDYNNKVSYYGAISNKFNQKVTTDQTFKGWYLPNWEDDTAWKKQHDKLGNQYGGSSLKGKYPTPELFRNYCFEEVQKNKDLENNGWFSDCGRERLWDKK